MLAYAANRPDPAGRQSSPNAMLFVVAVHIAAIAALMSYKMDLPRRLIDHPIIIDPVPIPTPPPPVDNHPVKPVPPASNNSVNHTIHKTTDPLPLPLPLPLPGDSFRDATGDLGSASDTGPGPISQPTPKPLPVQAGPVLLTPASQLRPPYPEMKLLNEEEADLRLRLSITADGRVAAVDPVGKADTVFLDAARRYLIDHWRYRPATIDGRAVATVTVITLSFRLDG